MRYIIVLFTLMTLSSAAWPDVIHFKNGGTMEGIIKEHDGEYVVIDVGVGTMSVREDEIDYVEEATPEEIERLKRERLDYEIDIGEWAPDGYEDISIIYLKTKNERAALRETRRKIEALQAEMAREEIKRSELLEMLSEKGQELKGIDAEKDVKRYNDVVAEINTLNADMNKENKKIESLRGDEKALNSKLAESVNDYRKSYQVFEDALDLRRKDIEEYDTLSDEVYFFEEMDLKKNDMERDFRRDMAPYTEEGEHIIVDVLINSSVMAELIVDTGASIVLISNDVATRLGIKYEDITEEIDIVLADGSSAKAKPVVLESVKVEDAEVKNVQAAIIENEVGGRDGLLGMSFLGHFSIKVDGTEKRLILERVL